MPLFTWISDWKDISFGGKFKSQASQADFPGKLNFLCLTSMADKIQISGKMCLACLGFEFSAKIQSEIQVKSPSGKAQYLSSERTMGAATTSIL